MDVLRAEVQPELQPHPEIKPSKTNKQRLESMGDITSLPRHVKEEDVIMLKCVIKNACGIGVYASQKVCRCPSTADCRHFTLESGNL